MALPYTYRALYQTEINANKLFFELRKKFFAKKITKIQFFQDKIFFNYNSFFFLGKANVVLDFTTDEGFYFEVVLEKILKVIVILIVIMAFVVSGLWNLLLLSGGLIFIIYILVIIDVHNSLTSFFDEVIGETQRPEVFSEEQLKWIKEKERCPACGEKLTEYDSFCPECGLNLKRYRKSKIQPVSRTGFYDYRIFYTLKIKDSHE